MAVHPSTRSVVTIHQYVQYVCVFISLLFYEKLNAVKKKFISFKVFYIMEKGGSLLKFQELCTAHCTLINIQLSQGLWLISEFTLIVVRSFIHVLYGLRKKKTQ